MTIVWYPLQGRSMWPLGPPWQAGVVPVPLRDLQPGQIVAFLGDRPGLVLLHRVVAIATDGLQTRGDTRETADPWLPASALLGRLEALRLGPLVVPVPHEGVAGTLLRRVGQGWSRVAPGLRRTWRNLRS